MILVSILAGMVAGGSVAAFFGDFWWPLDLVSNFRPQLLGASALLAATLALARRRWGLLVALAGLAVNLAVCAPLFFEPIPRGSPTSTSIRVVSFNLFDQNEDFEEVAEFLREADADVVFLHEAFEPWEDAIVGADLPYRVEVQREGSLIFATMVLVRGDAVVTGYGFAESEPRAVEVVLDTPNGSVSILGIHPLSPINEDRARHRDRQLAFAADWATEVTGRRVVVGDFNASPWSKPFRSLVTRTRLRNSQQGYGLELSFPTTSPPFLRVPIDHLLYSDGLIVVDRVLGPELGSDHLPLTVDLAFTR